MGKIDSARQISLGAAFPRSAGLKLGQPTAQVPSLGVLSSQCQGRHIGIPRLLHMAQAAVQVRPRRMHEVILGKRFAISE